MNINIFYKLKGSKVIILKFQTLMLNFNDKMYFTIFFNISEMFWEEEIVSRIWNLVLELIILRTIHEEIERKNMELYCRNMILTLYYEVIFSLITILKLGIQIFIK